MQGETKERGTSGTPEVELTTAITFQTIPDAEANPHRALGTFTLSIP